MRVRFRYVLWILVVAMLGVGLYAYAQQDDTTTSEGTAVSDLPTDRTFLPIPEPPPPVFTELDARDVTRPAPYTEEAPPEGAPNVIVILIDDIGFGAPSVFGGPVRMPNLDRLAGGGVVYNHFHTTALCSPTRMALKTGRNHHAVNTGSIMETATAFPGNTGIRPDNTAPLAEILSLNGYSTGAFGKSHEVPPWEVSVSGPMTRWPTRSGFDRFYGFLGGETNQWHPAIYDQGRFVEPPDDPDYHFTVDMTNRAISWMQAQQSLTPDKPFFMYYAPGAVHAPHHVPAEWADRYRGQFDAGWEAMREETLARQIGLGVVPEGTELAPMPEDIVPWDDLTDDDRRLFARQMEIWAGFGEHTDHQIGRLMDALEALGEMENTLVIAIIGDNGSSAEGGMVGLYNEYEYFNGVQPTVAEILTHYDELGGPDTYPHFAAGWAVAGGAPFAWTKQMAADFGGTRNPLIVHWPNRFAGDRVVRTQFTHVNDVAPTVLDAAGIPEPTVVNGVPQRPMDGVSMLYAIDDPDAPTRHTTQYFEMFGNRAIYHDGWLARTIHFLPWAAAPVRPLEEDVWELYDTTNDFSLIHDLAAEQPERLAELQALFDTEAVRNHVYPIDDRRIERFDAAVAGRPDLMHGRTTLTVYPGMTMAENAFINIKNRAFTVTADLDISADEASGVILAQAGQFGGWALYLDSGVPVFVYNFLGTEMYRVRGSRSLGSGQVQLVADFAYDGGGRGLGGTATLQVGDEQLGQGRWDRTQPNIFSADETADVGVDWATPVDPSYGHSPGNRFTGGTIRQVTIELH